jgi:hypothetical protein
MSASWTLLRSIPVAEAAAGEVEEAEADVRGGSMHRAYSGLRCTGLLVTPLHSAARLGGLRRPVPGSGVGVECQLVDNDGRILAVLSSIKQVPPELARIGRDRAAVGPVRVVRHDEHGDKVVGARSVVTASSLSSLWHRSRSR